MSVKVLISQGLFAIIDLEDEMLIRPYRWTAMRASQREVRHYAFRSASNGSRRTTLYMHRVIAGAKRGQIVDHINGDGLDNRRGNLRLGTLADNAVNRRYASASGYRGVFKEKSRWRAHIYRAGRKHCLGHFMKPEDAAAAYDEAAIRLHGDFAITNFEKARYL